MRSIGLLLPFTGTDRELVPYKVTIVVHEFRFIWPPGSPVSTLNSEMMKRPSNGFLGPQTFLLFVVVVDVDPEGYKT
jgi:hypothetical protein